MYRKIFFTLAASLFVLSACAPAAAAPEAMMEKPDDMMMEKPDDGMTEKSDDALMEKPAEMTSDNAMDSPLWFETSFTNVNTGETFMITDFKGKVVLVENLAMWCSNCKQQQMQVKNLHNMLGMNKDLVSIGLDIDINENADDLKAYTASNGFDWIYAVATKDVAREIGELYGEQFLNPPSTPILIIDRKGQVHPMPLGLKSADDLKAFIEPFLAESM